jgi:hypothetical protein
MDSGDVTAVVARVSTPAPREVWDRLYAEDATATLSQSPLWMDALTTSTRWVDASRCFETRDGRTFVLPLARRGPRGRGAVYASMPAGWGMGGLVSSSPITAADIAAVETDLRASGASVVRILPNPIRGDTWSAALSDRVITIPRYSHVVDLDGGFEKVWGERYRRTARRTVTKAREGELNIERDTSGRFIPIYRELFWRSVERWARRSNEPLPVARLRASREDPTGKLEFLAERLGDNMVTWVAFYRGKPAAADIILKGRNSFAWRGAMHEELGPETHAAYLLQNLAIEEACADGGDFYYLGESGPAKGIALFKERFGGIGYHYPEVRYERLPYTSANQFVRAGVKRIVGYRTS